MPNEDHLPSRLRSDYVPDLDRDKAIALSLAARAVADGRSDYEVRGWLIGAAYAGASEKEMAEAIGKTPAEVQRLFAERGLPRASAAELRDEYRRLAWGNES